MQKRHLKYIHMKADNDWKQRLGVVYSTNLEYAYDRTGAEEETETP